MSSASPSSSSSSCSSSSSSSSSSRCEDECRATMESWELMQEKAFRVWLNSLDSGFRFSRKEPLQRAFANGEALFALAKALFGSTLPARKHPTNRMRRLDAVSSAIELFREEGLSLTASPANFVDGDRPFVFGFIWSCFLRFVSTQMMQVHAAADASGGADDGGGSGSAAAAESTDAILEWVRERTSDEAYAPLLQGTTAHNFTTDWQSGSVMVALLHSEDASSVSLETALDRAPIERLSGAFSVAQRLYDIPMLLDPADMVDHAPDAKAVRMYVTLLYVAFRERARAREREARAMAEEGPGASAAELASAQAACAEERRARQELEARVAALEGQVRAQAQALADAASEQQVALDMASHRLSEAQRAHASEEMMLRASLSVLEMRAGAQSESDTATAALEARVAQMMAEHEEELRATELRMRGAQMRTEMVQQARVRELSGRVSSLEGDVQVLIQRLRGIYSNISNSHRLYEAVYGSFLTVDYMENVKVKSWLKIRRLKSKRRWCVLADNFIFIFRSNESGQQPHEVVRIDPCTVFHDAAAVSFTVTREGTTTTFVGDTNEICTAWVTAIDERSTWWSRDTNVHIIEAARRQNAMTMIDPKVLRQPDKYHAKFIEAVSHDRLERVRELIERGVDVNRSTPDGWRAIHTAAFHGHVRILGELIKAGADPQVPTVTGETAHGLALQRHHADVIEFLKVMTQATDSVPPTFLYVRLIEAHDLLPMDRNGYSDPYVCVQLGDVTFKSRRINKTLNPHWNQSLAMPLPPSGPPDVVHFTCMDWDRTGTDTFLGRFSITLADRPAVVDAAVPVQGWYDLQDVTSGRVHVEVCYR